jgi:heat shock protein HslJ
VRSLIVAAVAVVLLGSGALSSCSSSSAKTPAVLTGIEWHWTITTTSSPAAQVEVAEPSHYTLEFHPGDQVSIKADCNTGTGTYTAKGSSMTIRAGAMTAAQCPPGSQATDFMAKLAAVDSYLLVDGRLALELKNDAGELRFANGSIPTTTLAS